MEQNVETKWFVRIVNVCHLQSPMVDNEHAGTTVTEMGFVMRTATAIVIKDGDVLIVPKVTVVQEEAVIVVLSVNLYQNHPVNALMVLVVKTARSSLREQFVALLPTRAMFRSIVMVKISGVLVI